jgi:hypothetical protein
LIICEIGLSCESLEFGCSALIAGSVKRHFKHNTTTLFLGVGLKGSLGVVGVGAKAGATITIDDNNEVQDVGGKMDVSVSAGVGFSKIGTTSSASCTVMGGLKTKTGLDGGLKF